MESCKGQGWLALPRRLPRTQGGAIPGREGQGVLPGMVPDALLRVYTLLYTPGYTMLDLHLSRHTG